MTVTKISVTTKSRTINLLLVTAIPPTTTELEDRIKGVLGLAEEVLEVMTTEILSDSVFIL